MRSPATALLAALLAAATVGGNLPASRSTGHCLTGADAEGPFHVPDAPFRSRIVGRAATGVPLSLSGRVLANDCTTPVAGAVLDVWQADAGGCYSAVGGGPCAGTPSDPLGLRGKLRTDEAGRYSLQTVKPGGYEADGDTRTPHIHVKIVVGDREVLTTQLDFADEPRNTQDSLASAPGAAARTIVLQAAGDGLRGEFDFVVDVAPAKAN